MQTSNNIIGTSGIAFGTSGARGLVSDFTPEVCAAFTLAFISSIKSTSRLAIAIDNRPSSPAMAQACIAAAKGAGVEVDYYGVIPTPALAYKAQLDGVPAIMITGSHIPFDRNGLKFYTIAGEITKVEELAILQAEVEMPQLTLSPMADVDDSASNAYFERYTQVFPATLLSGLRVGVYQHSSAGRDLYPELFSKLGAEVIKLGYSDEFVPIDTEAVEESDRQQAKEWVQQHKLDLLFSTDGDGDRPLLADDTGEYLKGDILGLLSAQGLGIEALAVPISCNTAIEKSGAAKTVKRTRIGSPYVIEAFDALSHEFTSVAGFEANGGFLLATDIQIGGSTLARLSTRDAVLPVLSAVLQADSRPLSAVLQALPLRFTHSDRLKDFPIERSREIIKVAAESPQLFFQNVGMGDESVSNIDETDGLRITLETGDILHLRPSGNAPELRCYAESSDSAKARSIVSKVLTSLSSL